MKCPVCPKNMTSYYARRFGKCKKCVEEES